MSVFGVTRPGRNALKCIPDPQTPTLPESALRNCKILLTPFVTPCLQRPAGVEASESETRYKGD